jgi:hypothetical protein
MMDAVVRSNIETNARNQHMRWKFGRLEFCVLVVLLALLTLEFVTLTWLAPAGSASPSFVDDPSRRVHHADGFSILVPPNWERHGNEESFGIMLFPKSMIPSRSSASISVSRARETPDLGLYTKTQFHGSEAWERMHVVRKYSFDDPAYSQYEMYFEHHRVGYMIQYSVAKETTELPESVRRYLNSIEFEDRDLPQTEVGTVGADVPSL